MSDLACTVHDSVDAIPEWDDVAVAGGTYSSKDWCRIWVTHALAVRQNDVLLAVAPCVVATAPPGLPALASPWYLLTHYGDGHIVPFDAPMDQLYPAVFVGVPHGYSSRLLIREGLNDELRARIVASLIEGARQLAATHAAKLVMYGYYPEHDVRALRAVEPAIPAVFVDPSFAVGPLSSFEQYTHAHKKIGRELRQFSRSGMRIERRNLRDELDAIAALLVDHETKYGNASTLEDERAYLTKFFLAPGMEQRTRLLCAYSGDAMVGMSVSLLHGGTCDVRFGTVTEATPRTAAAFFNVGYHEQVRMACAEGATTIDFGVHSVEAKVARGCHPRPMWTALDWRTPRDAALDARLREQAQVRYELTAKTMRIVLDEGQFRASLGEALTLGF